MPGHRVCIRDGVRWSKAGFAYRHHLTHVGRAIPSTRE
jgi:hypothetical protein